MFITTKVWSTHYGQGNVIRSVKRQLQETGLEYFDMVLLHWPVVFADSDTMDTPKDENGQILFGDRNLKDIYLELEQSVHQKLTRSIGLSNFNAKQIDDILSVATVPPATNQVECHLWLGQHKLHQFCQERNIVLTAYCPLGRAGQWPGTPNLLEDEQLGRMATKYNKTPAQICIRWLVQRGILVIPKSIHRERMQQNIDVFSFVITPEDVQQLNSMDKGFRFVPFIKGTESSVDYPFHDEF